jgi:hypothetical protein
MSAAPLRQLPGASGIPTRMETVVVGCLFIGLSLFSDVLYHARPAGALSDL